MVKTGLEPRQFGPHAVCTTLCLIGVDTPQLSHVFSTSGRLNYRRNYAAENSHTYTRIAFAPGAGNLGASQEVAHPDPLRRLQGAPWLTPSCPAVAKRTSTETSAGP